MVIGFGLGDEVFGPMAFALFEEAKERLGDAEAMGLGFEGAAARDTEIFHELAELAVVDLFAGAPAMWARIGHGLVSDRKSFSKACSISGG